MVSRRQNPFKDNNDRTQAIVSIEDIIKFDPKGEFKIPDEPSYKGR